MSDDVKDVAAPICPGCKAPLTDPDGYTASASGVAIVLVMCPSCGAVVGAVEAKASAPADEVARPYLQAEDQ